MFNNFGLLLLLNLLPLGTYIASLDYCMYPEEKYKLTYTKLIIINQPKDTYNKKAYTSFTCFWDLECMNA